MVLGFFLSAPDDVTRKRIVAEDADSAPLDMLDVVAEFAEKLPGWVNEHGLPLSWRHYVYGMARIRRSDARDSIRRAGAHRASQAANNEYRSWRRTMEIAAGY